MITITKPVATDAASILDVFYKTWLATYPNAEAGITREDIEEHFKDRHSLEILEQRKQRISFLSEQENTLYLVAKDAEKVVGICLFIKKENCNQLQAIYVLPEYQGRGIGHMFWKKCLEFLDPSKPTIVQLATYNTQARAFYQKLGFVDTGKRLTEERHRMPISKMLIPEMEMELKNKISRD